MSQLFDYFVCSRPIIERWADAVEQQDDELQQTIESQMPRLLTLRNIGPDEFNILAQCVEGDDVDTVDAVGQLDLVRAISEEGPWLMAFRQPAVDAIAGMSVDVPLIQRWCKAVAEFFGTSEDFRRELLSTETAKSWKDLCSLAIEKRFGVFVCFYG